MGESDLPALRGSADLGGQRTQKVADRIARALTQYIVDNGLEPGDSLPNEREMTETLGVSRGSLREALRLLETQGVILVRPGPGGGPVVREPQPGDLVNSASLILQVMRVHFDRVLDAREAVLPEIIRLAAKRRSAPALADLGKQLSDLEVAIGDRVRFWASYHSFHEALGFMTGNEILTVFYATLLEISGPFESHLAYPDRNARALITNHREIVAGIGRRDGEAAASEGAAHLKAYRSYFARNHPDQLEEPVRWAQS